MFELLVLDFGVFGVRPLVVFTSLSFTAGVSAFLARELFLPLAPLDDGVTAALADGVSDVESACLLPLDDLLLLD